MLDAKVEPKNIIARDVTFEEYMEKYAEHFTEWVEGMVITLSPVTEDHDSLFRYLIRLLETYLEESGEGWLRVAPFVMKIAPDSPAREPDLQIVLQENADRLKPTMTAGVADIAIEIISKESRARDVDEKYDEYQAGGVREYWLIDPLRRVADFYALAEDGLYQRVELEKGVFQSRILSRFRLDTALLWQEKLPTGRQITAMVEAMLGEKE